MLYKLRSHPVQTNFYWVVETMWRCTPRYDQQFPIQSTQGIFCIKTIPLLPLVLTTTFLELESCAAVIWYSDGTYCPLYVKMWEYLNGERMSTAYVYDGRFVAFGHWHCTHLGPPVRERHP